MLIKIVIDYRTLKWEQGYQPVSALTVYSTGCMRLSILNIVYNVD
jgi:hypothetical protein